MMAGAFLAIAVLELIGAAVFTLLCAEPKRWGLAGKLGLSFGLGLVGLTVSLFLLSWGGIKPAWWLGVLVMIALWAAAFGFRRGQLAAWRPEKSARRSPPPKGWEKILEWTLLAFIAGICAVVSAVSLLEPLVEWDVLAIWAMKAKVLLHEPASLSGYFTDVSKAYSHLDYPLLWPMAMAWVWTWTDQSDLLAVKALAPALLCSIVALFFGLLRRKHSRTHALVFTALLAGVPMLLSQTSRLMSDAPLALFVMGAFICCYLWLESSHPDDLRLAGVLAAGMLFTKNEGIGLLAILALIAAMAIVAQRRMKLFVPAVVWLAAVPLLLTAVWFVFRLGIPKVHEDYGGRINPVHFLTNASRGPEVLSGSLGVLGNWNDWLLLWPLAALGLAVAPMNWLRRPGIYLFLAATLPLLMYGYVYVVSPWDLKELMETTANRLLLHVTPLWVFFLAEQAEAAQLLPFGRPSRTRG